MEPNKFCHLESGGEVPHDYGNLYFRQQCGNSERIVIGPSKNHVNLLIEFADELRGQPWFVLYVLLVPRLKKYPAGRYQSQPFKTHMELSSFLSAFRSFFEGDGRHHVWVGSASKDGQLVYDQHNVIFAYGPLVRFEQLLHTKGFRKQEFWFPMPHVHSYTDENDAEEERLMAEMEWKYFPLQPGDAWN